MNNIVKKIGVAALTASMIFGVVALAACNNGNKEEDVNQTHKHSLTQVAAVPAGCLTEGSKEYYTCGCGKWFEDKNANIEIVDHTSVTVQATGHNWDDGVISDDNTTKTFTCKNCQETKSEVLSSSTQIYTITYNYNYEGAPEADVVKYEGGKPATAPENPVHTDKDYTFKGWYLESSCTTKYNFTENMTADIVLYANWAKETLYVFEAEYTKIKTLSGVGWSNTAKGLDMIMRDTNGAIGKPGLSEASNGFYVGYLYKSGITLTFEINSDIEVDDAILTLRVSGEMTESIVLSGDDYMVKVNGEQIDYPGITITGIDPAPDAEKHKFQDFLVTTSLSLVEGKNTITLTTNNGIKLGGTATATAPLVDCIKIQTSSTLTWSPYTNNLADWE